MFGSGKKKNAAKKAYEMAYALFRISAKIAESSVKEKLESCGIELLVSMNTEEYDEAAKAVVTIDALVKFAMDLNMVSISNGDVLIREAAAMNEAIVENLDKSDEIDISKFFSSASQEKQGSGTSKSSLDSVVAAASRPLVLPRQEMPPVHPSVTPSQFSVILPSRDTRQAPVGSHVFPEGTNPNPVLQEDGEKEEIDNQQSGKPAVAVRSGNRQIAILDRIRQTGNCKLRDIQEILPDCSERTIRYDLEDLIERNLIERTGAGGPAVSYRVRQIA